MQLNEYVRQSLVIDPLLKTSENSNSLGSDIAGGRDFRRVDEYAEHPEFVNYFNSFTKEFCEHSDISKTGDSCKMNDKFTMESICIEPLVWSVNHTENIKVFIENFNKKEINALKSKMEFIELLDRNDEEFYPYYYMLPKVFKCKVNQLILLSEIYWNMELKTLTEAIDVCKSETILKSVSNQSSETDGVLVVFETPNCVLTFNYIFDSRSTIGGISLKSAKVKG